MIKDAIGLQKIIKDALGDQYAIGAGTGNKEAASDLGCKDAGTEPGAVGAGHRRQVVQTLARVFKYAVTDPGCNLAWHHVVMRYDAVTASDAGTD